MTVAIYTSEDFTVETGQNQGLVSSVDVSGGVSGLTFSGGPITGSGIITLSAGLLTVTYGGTGATSFTAGQVLYGNGTSAIQSSANFFWDSGNSRLGIGTNVPTVQLDTTGRVRLASGFGSIANNTPVIQIGDGTYAVSALYKYGLALNSDVSNLLSGEGVYGAWVSMRNTSATSPGFVVGLHAVGATTTSIDAVEGLTGIAKVENTGGAVTLAGPSRAIYAGAETSGAGTKAIYEFLGVWQPMQFTGGAAAVTAAIQFWADTGSSGPFPGVGSFASATVNDLISFYSVAPTNGTIYNRSGFRHDDWNNVGTGNYVGFASSRFAFMQTQPVGQRSFETGVTHWGSVLAGPKSAFMGRVGIGTYNPRFALSVATDDSDGFTAPTLAATASIEMYINDFANQQYLYRSTNPYYPLNGLYIAAAPGSLANPLATQTDQYLGTVVFAGRNEFYPAGGGRIYGYAEGTFTAADGAPTSIIIGTGLGSTRNSPGNNGWFDRLEVNSHGSVRLDDQPFCRAWMGSNQNILNATATSLAFNNESPGVQSTTARLGTPLHSTSVNNQRFTVTYAGLYLCIGQVSFTPSATGMRSLNIQLNAGVYIGTTIVPNNHVSVATVMQVSAIHYLNYGDYIEFTVYQNSGSGLDVNSGINGSWGLLYKVA